MGGGLLFVISPHFCFVLLAALLCAKLFGSEVGAGTKIKKHNCLQLRPGQKGKRKKSTYYLVKLVNQFHKCMKLYNVCLTE